LYFANSTRLAEEILTLTGEDDEPVRWLCLDASAIADVDYSGGQTLNELAVQLRDRRTHLVLAEVEPDVRKELDRYGFTDLIGADAYFETVHAVIEAFRNSDPAESG
jgi:MFS superfamily sulfate permease-like transporter